MTADRYSLIDGSTVLAYANSSAVGATQDTRGVRVLFAHPGNAGVAKTNDTDYLPITTGWYDYHVQEAVARWSEHNATDRVNIRANMRITDTLMPNVQWFDWTYGANGYLSLTHSGPAGVTNVMSVEAIYPVPYIAEFSVDSGVADLTWSTNGVMGSWGVFSTTNLAVPDWQPAVILATNNAPAGYMSVSASNSTWSSGACFFRIAAVGGIQQAAIVRFGPPIRAPRYELADGVYLAWSNGVLRIQNGASNGTVNVTW